MPVLFLPTTLLCVILVCSALECSLHRNYLELGSEVHIDMYDDRLEIYSPGGLMDGGSIKDMDIMNMASRRRNPDDSAESVPCVAL